MRTILFLMLLTSITSQTYAQYQPDPESIFEIPAAKLQRTFLITLERKDKMQIELTSIEDLVNLRNVDSIVGLFLRDIGPLKDSLSEAIYARRIDYIADTATVKKIRIQTYRLSREHFAVTDGFAAPLKLQQDTITIVGKVRSKIKAGLVGYYEGYAYYRVSFFLNNLHNLAKYVDGELNEKVKTLEANVNSIWVRKLTPGVYLKKDPDISAPYLRGYTVYSQPVGLRFAVNLQNYKDNFIPSSSYAIIFVRRTNEFRYKFGVQYENHFYFSKNSLGKLETYINDFATLVYERENNLTSETKATARFTPSLSLGYLVKRRGDLYKENTFKLGLGRYAFIGPNTRFEPVFYFDKFFKGISPSLRLTQYF